MGTFSFEIKVLVEGYIFTVRFNFDEEKCGSKWKCEKCDRSNKDLGEGAITKNHLSTNSIKISQDNTPANGTFSTIERTILQEISNSRAFNGTPLCDHCWSRESASLKDMRIGIKASRQ